MNQQVVLKLAVAEDRHGGLLRHPVLATATTRTQQSACQHLLRHRPPGAAPCRRPAAPAQAGRIVATDDQAPGPVGHGGLTMRPEWQAPYLNHFDFSRTSTMSICANGCNATRSTAASPPCSRRTCAAPSGSWTRHRIPASRSSSTAAGSPPTAVVKRSPNWNCNWSPAASTASTRSPCNWRNAKPLPPLLLSKAERGYRLFRGTLPAPVKGRRCRDRCRRYAAGCLSPDRLDCLAHLQLNHDGAVHLDDPEYVHQMRVAMRRLRAALRMFRPVLPEGFAEQLVLPMRELMATLGQARDLDVLMGEIVAPVAAALPDEPRLADLSGAITNRLYAARAEIRQVLRRPSLWPVPADGIQAPAAGALHRATRAGSPPDRHCSSLPTAACAPARRDPSNLRPPRARKARRRCTHCASPSSACAMPSSSSTR
jgi:hypothetical protein